MTKSKSRKNSRRSKRRTIKHISFEPFEKRITTIFFETLLMIKLYHWKTYSYASHKATDELYGKLNEHMDKFMEVLLGKDVPNRMHFASGSKISLIDLSTKEELVSKIEGFKSYLVGLSDELEDTKMTNTDLLNIRDEILGDMNQFLYLLSLK